MEANALLSRCTDLVGKIATHKTTIEEIVTIMVLNQLPSQFDTIKEIKRNEAKSTDSVPKLEYYGESHPTLAPFLAFLIRPPR